MLHFSRFNTNHFYFVNIELCQIILTSFFALEHIETFYNTVRIHSHCDYMSPAQYEKLYDMVTSLPAA